ncbi:MAG TPA: DUF2157 domain-containing protein [Vicinamibacterales bacterium]|jgi:hypothetical protein|nr:DUF2157 domain-containing protein [Vicinamibacterales bacterium]
MTTLERLRGWNQEGILSDAQHDSLAALIRREHFSVFLELNALLYIGVIAFVGGLGWTFETYSADLGDAFILAACSVLFAGCLYYCFSRGSRYSHAEVESPHLAFDYVLYLGCLTLSAELAYIEFRFHLFQGAWDHYLLFTSATFALLAYRFDNRFVLSLALASLAGWFGLSVSAFGFRSSDSLRISALVYGAFVAATGTALHRLRIKPHFLESYLHVAANTVFTAVVSGVIDRSGGALYLVLLAVLAAAVIALGVRFARFAFVAYGIVYGYAGVTIRIMRHIDTGTATFGYLVVTGTLVIILLVVLARRFGRDE